MNLTANTIIKLFIDAIGQDALKDFYEHNWEARKKEIQKLLKSDYDFYVINDPKFQRVLEIFTEFVDWARTKDYINLSDKIAILDRACSIRWSSRSLSAAATASARRASSATPRCIRTCCGSWWNSARRLDGRCRRWISRRSRALRGTSSSWPRSPRVRRMKSL